MRKYLTASLIACLVSTSLVGCGDKPQDVQVSEKLDALLEQMSLLQYADAPIEGNELVYTLGKEVDGVKVPGSTRFEAAYLDQALALLPLAEEIESEGTTLQKQSANAIIGSIRTEEAAFLIDEAERAFHAQANDVVALRHKLGVLRNIQALNKSVAGERDEVIETYRAGLNTGGATVIGINGLRDQASGYADKASQAKQDLAKYSEQIAELREKVSEYESLELKLSSQARSSKAPGKFDKMDQATSAAKEAELAQAEAQKFEIDAWIAERAANLAEFRRQQLAGEKQSATAGLLGKLDGFLAKASAETNIPDSSDTYAGVAQALTQAKSATGDDTLKAAAFLLSLNAYGTAAAVDSDERIRLVAAINEQIKGYLGVIGVLEMKVAQIKLHGQRVADQLAEIERDRQAVIDEFAADFEEHDAEMRVTAFDRMAQAVETLKLAEEAVKASGSGTDMELMSVYTLHARALQQQSVSARMYSTGLSAIAAAGPELLGSDLHGKLTTRVDELQTLLAEVGAAAGELQAAAGVTSANVVSGADAESSRGQVAAKQVEVYDALLASLGPVTAPAPEAAEEEAADEAPASE